MSITSSILNFCRIFRILPVSKIWQFQCLRYWHGNKGRMKNMTQCSDNCVKNWRGQLFLIPGLVWKRVSPLDAILRAQSAAIFCIWPFSAWWRTNGQPGDPIASLLLTSEKAVFCDIANAQRKSTGCLKKTEFCQIEHLQICHKYFFPTGSRFSNCSIW